MPTGNIALTDSGETCENRRLTPLASRLECKAHTQFIEHYPKIEEYLFDKEVDDATFPKGCFIRLSFDPGMGDRGYFNSHLSGAGHAQSRAVCDSKLIKRYRIFETYFEILLKYQSI